MYQYIFLFVIIAVVITLGVYYLSSQNGKKQRALGDCPPSNCPGAECNGCVCNSDGDLSFPCCDGDDCGCTECGGSACEKDSDACYSPHACSNCNERKTSRFGL